MGYRLQPDRAREIFREALTIARSDQHLPAAPRDTTQRLHVSKSKTFTPVYGTALLAKATDPRIDPHALQKASGERGFAAPSIARVFFEETKTAGVDARCTTHAFHNNQPFLSRARIAARLMTSCKDQAGLRVLVKALDVADTFDRHDAVFALASFLRERASLAPATPPPPALVGSLGFTQTAHLLTAFIDDDSEGGRRGQAFLAACLRLAYGGADMAKVNDPSFKSPGDVVVRDGSGKIIIAAEAKQKAVTAPFVIAACEGAAKHGVWTVIYAALHPDQTTFDANDEVLRRTGVIVDVYTDPISLLRASLIWSDLDASNGLARVREEFRVALIEMDVHPSSIDAWDTQEQRALAEPGGIAVPRARLQLQTAK